MAEKTATRRYTAAITATVALLLWVVAPVQALDIHGQLADEQGNPVADAMVILAGGSIDSTTVSVFTDQQGLYKFENLGLESLDGVDLRIKSIGYQQVGEPEIGAPSQGTTEINFAMQSMDNVAKQVPPSAWLNRFPDERATHAIILNCTQCHNFPHPKVQDYTSKFTDLPMEGREQVWRDVFRFMRVKAMGLAPGDMPVEFENLPLEIFADDTNNGFNHADEDTMAPILAKYMSHDFSEFSMTDYQKLRAPVGAVGTVYKEYQLPPPEESMFHDTNIARLADGRIATFSVDWINRRMARVIPATGELKMYTLPKEVIGPHTVVPDSEGNIWVTFQVTGQIGRFDTAKETWELWDTGKGGWTESGGGLVHSFANDSMFEMGFDVKGRLWASLGGLNRLVALNPETGKVETFAAPATKDDSPFSTGLYGGVMTKDGKHIWFTQLQGHLFSFNTETDEVETVIPFPRGAGPRRLAIDNDDVIYMPLYGSGELYVYDAKANKEIGRYKLPDRGASPYTVNWDASRNAVWLAAGNSNLVYRFDVATKTFIEYPLPSEGTTIIRAIPVDQKTGNVYFSYAPVSHLKGPHMVVEMIPGEPNPGTAMAAQ